MTYFGSTRKYCHKGTYQHRRYNRQERKANVGAGTATATEPTREHKQYATQGPTTYLCT